MTKPLEVTMAERIKEIHAELISRIASQDAQIASLIDITKRYESTIAMLTRETADKDERLNDAYRANGRLLEMLQRKQRELRLAAKPFVDPLEPRC